MNKKISVRIPTEMADFLAETGGGDRGRSDGVRRVVEFAQMTPRAFAAFLGGERFADVGELKRLNEPCDVDDSESNAPDGERCSTCGGTGRFCADCAWAGDDGTGER